MPNNEDIISSVEEIEVLISDVDITIIPEDSVQIRSVLMGSPDKTTIVVELLTTSTGDEEDGTGVTAMDVRITAGGIPPAEMGQHREALSSVFAMLAGLLVSDELTLFAEGPEDE